MSRRQFYRGVADVDLAGHCVGYEAGAVLVHQVDLTTGGSDGAVDVMCRFINPMVRFVSARRWKVTGCGSLGLIGALAPLERLLFAPFGCRFGLRASTKTRPGSGTTNALGLGELANVLVDVALA